jgi:hypothetical protein
MSKEKPLHNYVVRLTVDVTVNGDNRAEAVQAAIETIKGVTTQVESVHVILERSWRQ